jgi:dTMP kinase
MAIGGGKCRPRAVPKPKSDLVYAPPVPFVTFEGVEGSGKTTQLALAADRLRTAGKSVRTTREPGGTPIGERIRAVLLDPAHRELDPMAEWLLVEAARRQHLREVVRPALENGAFVLCDRFSDSTEAYQVAGRGLDATMVEGLDGRVRGGLAPDLTLLYDLDPREGLARARGRDASPGRFESAALEFHERVRSGFLAAARREPRRIAVVPADGGTEAVFALTWRILSERFGLS